jgi:hypothetical protein
MTKGRQLTFTDDDVSPWGPGWEFSFGLQYKEVKFVKRNIQNIVALVNSLVFASFLSDLTLMGK